MICSEQCYIDLPVLEILLVDSLQCINFEIQPGTVNKLVHISAPKLNAAATAFKPIQMSDLFDSVLNNCHEGTLIKYYKSVFDLGVRVGKEISDGKIVENVDTLDSLETDPKLGEVQHSEVSSTLPTPADHDGSSMDVTEEVPLQSPVLDPINSKIYTEYKGVAHSSNGGHCALIILNGRTVPLGEYPFIDEAAKAHDIAYIRCVGPRKIRERYCYSKFLFFEFLLFNQFA